MKEKDSYAEASLSIFPDMLSRPLAVALKTRSCIIPKYDVSSASKSGGATWPLQVVPTGYCPREREKGGISEDCRCVRL